MCGIMQKKKIKVKSLTAPVNTLTTCFTQQHKSFQWSSVESEPVSSSTAEKKNLRQLYRVTDTKRIQNIFLHNRAGQDSTEQGPVNSDSSLTDSN